MQRFVVKGEAQVVPLGVLGNEPATAHNRCSHISFAHNFQSRRLVCANRVGAHSPFSRLKPVAVKHKGFVKLVLDHDSNQAPTGFRHRRR